MCAKVTAAVRGLEEEFAGKVEFRIDRTTSAEGKAAMKRNGWESVHHGLEAVAKDGTVVGNLPGHNYGPEKVRAQVEALLKHP